MRRKWEESKGATVGMPRSAAMDGERKSLLDAGWGEDGLFECTGNHLRDARELATAEIADAMAFPPFGPKLL